MPHYTVEVPEMFSFRSPPADLKPDPTASEPTGPGYHEELSTLCNSHEPSSSQIEFSEQEEDHFKPEDPSEEFFPRGYSEPEMVAPVLERSRMGRSVLLISM
jgi:hypothetical protein